MGFKEGLLGGARETMAADSKPPSDSRCHNCAGPLAKDMETSAWTVPPFVRDSFAMIGTAVGGMASSIYGFNYVMPIVQKRVKGPMWLHFLVGNIIFCPLILILVPILLALSFHQALFSLMWNDPYSGNGSFRIIMIFSSMVGLLILKLRVPAVMRHLTGNLIASLFGLLACSAGMYALEYLLLIFITLRMPSAFLAALLYAAPPVIVFSSTCAGLAGGAVPAVAQLASSSYHAVVTSHRLPPPSSQDDKMHKTGTAL